MSVLSVTPVPTPCSTASEVSIGTQKGRFCCNVWLWWWISGERDHPTSQAATSNSAAMNSAWALMSLPPMFQPCPFLIIAIAS